jgi:hypothetical protein
MFFLHRPEFMNKFSKWFQNKNNKTGKKHEFPQQNLK